MENREIKTREISEASSMRLIKCLTGITGDNAIAAKTEMVQIITDLMPAGKVDIQKIFERPTIKQLAITHGSDNLLKSLYLLVLDFCKSMNVKYNMNDAQILDAAGMLLDQAGNYRLEDYACMFTMAKRSQLDVDIKHSVDIKVIAQIEQAYDRYSTELLSEVENRLYSEEKHERFKESQRQASVLFPAYWSIGAYGVQARKIYTFRAVTNHLQHLKQDIADQKEKDAADYRRRQAESYAKLIGINYEEILKQFHGSKLEYPKPSENWDK